MRNLAEVIGLWNVLSRYNDARSPAFAYAIAKTKINVRPTLTAYEETRGKLSPEATDEEKAEHQARMIALLEAPLQEDVKIHAIPYDKLPEDEAQRPTADDLGYFIEIGFVKEDENA